jgi:hypothetical protein
MKVDKNSRKSSNKFLLIVTRTIKYAVKKTKNFLELTKRIYNANRQKLNRELKIVAVLVVFIGLIAGYNYFNRPNYVISGAAQKLVGTADYELANSRLNYSKKSDSFILNTKLNGTKSPLSQYEAGIHGGDGAYGFNAPANLSKKNVMTFYDNIHNISFSLNPTFKTATGKYSRGQIVYPMNNGAQDVYSVKSNGLKEDIILNKFIGNTASFTYKLDLPHTLQAKIMPSGAIGIYSANPTLFGNISYSDSSSQATVMKAQENSAKNFLAFILMTPTVAASGGKNNTVASFKLKGDMLSINTSGLSKLSYPISIDPSVVVSSASPQFGIGNNDYNTNVSSTSISTALITGGTTGSWSSPNSPTQAMEGSGIAESNGYMYIVGGKNGSTYYNTVSYASVSGGAAGAWAATATFTTNRAFGSVQVYNGYLYIIGGQTNANVTNCSTGSGSTWFCSDIQYAPICNGTNTISGCTTLSTVGTLGTWTTETTATSGFTAKADLASVTNNGYLYVLGGYNGTTYSNNIYYSKFNGDGSVTAFSSALANTISYATVAGEAASIYNGYLYIMGGYNGTTDTTSGIYIQMPSSGPLSTITAAQTGTTAALPQAADNFGLAIYSGYIYVYGGLTAGYASTTVATSNKSYAQINANGSIGSWTATTQAATLYGAVSLTTYNGYIYQIGGINGAGFGAAYSSPISSAGTASTTSFSTNSGPTNLFMPGVAFYNGYIYVVGGCLTDAIGTKPCVSGQVSSTVYYATISSAGVVGTWTADTNILPNPVFGEAVLAAQGTLYAFQGCISAGAVANFSCGNFVKNTVSALINTNGTAPLGSTGAFVGNLGPTVDTSGGAFGLGVAYNDGYVYIFGGCTADTGTYLCGGAGGPGTRSNVFYAILASGAGNMNGGFWSSATNSMPYAEFGFGYAVYNSRLYVTGGCEGSSSTTTECNNFSTQSAEVWYTTLLPAAGGDSVWTKATNGLSGGNFGLSLYAANGYLYTVGGCTALANNTANGIGCATGSLSNVVNKAAITSTGDIATFTSVGATLTTAVWGGGGFIYNGNLMHFLGCSGASSSSALVCGTVYSSFQQIVLNSGGSGTISSWNTGNVNTSLQVARSAAKVVTYGGYLYVVGGYTTSSQTNCTSGSGGTFYCDDIEQYILSPNGPIWQATYTYGAAYSSAYSSVVAYNGYLYITGGRAYLFGGFQGQLIIGAINSTTGALSGFSVNNPTNWPAGIPAGGTTINSYNNTLIAYNGYMTIASTYNNGVYSAPICNGVQITTSCPLTSAAGSLGAVSVSTGSLIAGDAFTIYNGYVYYYYSGLGSYILSAKLNSGGGMGTSTQMLYGDLFFGLSIYVSMFAYDGYLYIVGATQNSSASYNNCNSTATATSDCDQIWAASIATNGGLGSLSNVGTLQAPMSNVSSAGYDGFLYYASSDNSSYNSYVYYTQLNLMPHIAEYSYANNALHNEAPGEVYLIGNNIGNYGNGALSLTGGNSLSYAFAANNTDCATTSYNTSSYAKYNSSSFSLINAALPLTMSQDGCAQASQKAQYTYLNLGIDDSYKFTFPDDNLTDGSHTTISDIGLYSHPLPVNRLRTGQLLINGIKSPLDAPQ